jgi:hypothetical protein
VSTRKKLPLVRPAAFAIRQLGVVWRPIVRVSHRVLPIQVISGHVR